MKNIFIYRLFFLYFTIKNIKIHYIYIFFCEIKMKYDKSRYVLVVALVICLSIRLV